MLKMEGKGPQCKDVDHKAWLERMTLDYCLEMQQVSASDAHGGAEGGLSVNVFLRLSFAGEFVMSYECEWMVNEISLVSDLRTEDE
jgi:hypothetical protein